MIIYIGICGKMTVDMLIKSAIISAVVLSSDCTRFIVKDNISFTCKNGLTTYAVVPMV